MKFKYQYLFIRNAPTGARIVRSSESEDSLLNRASTSEDAADISSFIEDGRVGSFIHLSSGEFVFQTSE